MENKEIKKILYLVTQSEWGGAQCYIFDLASNLNEEFEIIVAAGPEGNDENGLLFKLNQSKIKTISLKYLKRAINPWFDFLAFWELYKLFKTQKPDIIHLNSSKVGILGSLVSFLFKNTLNHKLIYTVHGWVFNEPLNFFKKKFYFWLEKITAKFKNKIICVSEYDQQTALKYKICPPEKLITIHNGIDISQISFLSKKEAKEELLKNYKTLRQAQDDNIISHLPIIGTIANFYPTKGLNYFLEAINLLITYYSSPVIGVIIGDGKNILNLKSQISNLKLENNLILVGQKKEAFKYLKAFDIYVCSSVKEGFPYSILEAMAAGLAVVSTNVGGIPEMIKNEFNGLLVSPRNPKAMAEKIKLLIDNNQRAEKLGENAKNLVTEKFSLKEMIKKTKVVYKL